MPVSPVPPGPGWQQPSHSVLPHPSLSLSDVLLLLCVFHFNGNVKGAAPYLALYPSASRDQMGPGWYLLAMCAAYQIDVLWVNLKKIPNAGLHGREDTSAT